MTEGPRTAPIGLVVAAVVAGSMALGIVAVAVLWGGANPSANAPSSTRGGTSPPPTASVQAPATTAAPTTSLDADAIVATAQVELESLAAQRLAVDYSRLSVSECGIFAMIVRPDGLDFLEWRDGEWADRSQELGALYEAPPMMVTTNDYTFDGARDFLVAFDGAALGGRQFGGIFAHRRCAWGWTDIVSLAGYVSPVIDGLIYEDDLLSAVDYLPQGGRAEVFLVYEPGSDYFYTETFLP